MVDLGHVSKAIPFYAIFPSDGGEAIRYDEGLLRQGTLLEMLKKAGHAPGRSADATAMKLR